MRGKESSETHGLGAPLVRAVNAPARSHFSAPFGFSLG